MFLIKLRLRVFAVLAGLITAVIATVSLTALPAIPVIGVAIITAAALVNGMTSRLAEPVCVACGKDLSNQVAGTYGVICPDCGAFTQTGVNVDPTVDDSENGPGERTVA